MRKGASLSKGIILKYSDKYGEYSVGYDSVICSRKDTKFFNAKNAKDFDLLTMKD